MGVCLSCCQTSDAEENEYENRRTERTPLLQDPTAILQQPRPEPTPEDQQRDQEALARIVDRTAENLIDIQTTFDERSMENRSDKADKIAQFKYLVDRLQSHGRSLDQDQAEDSGADTTKPQSTPEFVPSQTAITNEEKKVLDTMTKQVTDALRAATTIKPVGDVVVKLSWT